MAFDTKGFFGDSSTMGGLSGLLSGLFNDKSAPFESGQDIYNQYLGQAGGFLNPFIRRGGMAGRLYQNQLNQMSDPAGFLNNLIGQYQESPYTQFLKQQGQRQLTNAASASGLTGSTPLMQFGLDYNNALSQSGLNNWLAQVLGVNKDFLGGESDIYGRGAQAAGLKSGLYGQAASDQANMEIAKGFGEQSSTSDILGGLVSLLGNAAKYAFGGA